MRTMIIKEGRHTAIVAIKELHMFPVTEYPMYVALLIPKGPGVIWEIAIMSVKVEASTHW